MSAILIDLLKMMYSFFKIGMFGFGGGMAMLPYIEQEVVVVHSWLTNGEFLDLLAISQSTPGPIAINAATFVGFKTYSVIGAVFSTIGIVTFSFVMLNLLSKYLDKYEENKKVKNLFKTLRPITIGFIFAAAFTTGQKIIIDFKAVAISLIAFAILYTGKIHPIKVVFAFGVLGILIAFIA